MLIPRLYPAQSEPEVANGLCNKFQARKLGG